MTVLKPCPFCGLTPGTSQTEHEYKGLKAGYQFVIYCVHCGTKIKGTSITDMLTAMERATKRWNRRVGE